MVDIITSTANLNDIDSIQSDLDQFMICHYYQLPMYISQSEMYMNHLTVYYKDGMDESELEELEESYGSKNNFKFRFVGVSFIQEALDKIMNRMEHNADKEDDSVDIILALEPTPARLFKSYLNKECINREIPAEAMSLLNYSAIASLHDLTESMKTLFNTEFIYQEDPIQYAYICRKYYEGVYK